MGRLREQKIIATLAAFAGSGVVIIDVPHHILVNHYHFPSQIADICIVSVACALLGTLIWRWFRKAKKRPGNVKVEVRLFHSYDIARGVRITSAGMESGFKWLHVGPRSPGPASRSSFSSRTI